MMHLVVYVVCTEGLGLARVFYLIDIHVYVFHSAASVFWLV